MKEGRAERMCSAYESRTRASMPIVKITLAGTDALVLSAAGRAHNAVCAIWRPSSANQAACSEMFVR